MIKVDIISGFLGAGKTTLIKKLFESSIKSEKVALIENEFGEIGIDGTFLKNSGIEIKEINSGCICCSLVGNFGDALKELVSKYNPDRIIIEPSGVGKLSEIINAVKGVDIDLKLNIVCTVVDGGKCKMYSKNFGEFYLDQIIEANTIVVSKTDKLSEDKIISACEHLKEHNPTATIITTPITELNGKLLLENLEDSIDLTDFVIKNLMAQNINDHHHDHDCCEHEHHHDHDCCEHEHHHDHDCCEHGHHHDHDCCEHEHHDHECCCGHHHEHNHKANEVFDSWGKESPISYTKEQLENILKELATNNYGVILRAKGVVKGVGVSDWYYFDFVSGDYDIRTGEPDVISKTCVIGSNLNIEKIEELFSVRG